MNNFHCGLGGKTSVLQSYVSEDIGAKTWTRPENERVVSNSTCEDACVDFTGMYEGIKVVKRTKNFLQAGLLLYRNSFQPSPLYHKKDLVSMFKGSLTILSWSMHVFFPSSHAFHVASSLLFMIFIVFTRVKHFRVWNVFVLLRLVSLSKDLFASGLKRQNRKECNVRPHHDIQHILSSDQPRAICTWIPWQHLPVKLVTLFFSAPNQRYWKYEHAEYDGLFFYHIERNSLCVWWAHMLVWQAW